MKKNISWRPIVENKIISSHLNLISNALYESIPENNYSLFCGDLGIALFFYYYWLFTKDTKYYDKANAFLINGLNKFGYFNKSLYSICNGICGFMWAIHHLSENDFIDADCEELFKEEDLNLSLLMMSDIKTGKYDYLHGALGPGFYFLARNSKKSMEFVKSLIVILEQIADKDKNGLKWRSQLDPELGDVYNTGMAHGMASIIVFLCEAYKQEIYKDQTKKLLIGTINYILSLKSEKPDLIRGSFFPNFVSADDKSMEFRSRLGWCYGDIGVGLSLLFASKVLANGEWGKIAIKVLIQTTLRKDPRKESINDAGICHGAAGLTHIYNRLYQYTKLEVFKNSAIYWLQLSLRKAAFNNGIAGYKSYVSDNKLVNDKGLLTGAAGIGLVYISAASDVEPKWDKCFLIS